MYNTLAGFTQNLLDDNVVTSFPVYTKICHPNENIEHCQRASKIQSK